MTVFIAAAMTATGMWMGYVFFSICFLGLQKRSCNGFEYINLHGALLHLLSELQLSESEIT